MKIEKIINNIENFKLNHKILELIWKFFKIIVEFISISLIVVTIVFFLINSIPGTNGLTVGLDKAQTIIVEHQYGLDLPMIERYGRYISGIFRGDFGVSYSLFPFKEINSFIWDRFFVSFLVGILSVIVTLLVGIPVGIWVGKNPGKFADNTFAIIISFLIAIPSMVFAILLLLLGKAIGIPYIFERSNAVSYILPILALSLGSTMAYVRYIRTELNSELSSTHSKFAYLKGATKTRFVWRHALKPALFPVVTFFPTVLLSSFIGSMFIEQVFMIPGAGGVMLSAIQAKDYNVILFLVIVYSFATILSFTLRDSLYKVLDPRIRRKG